MPTPYSITMGWLLILGACIVLGVTIKTALALVRWYAKQVKEPHDGL